LPLPAPLATGPNPTTTLPEHAQLAPAVGATDRPTTQTEYTSLSPLEIVKSKPWPWIALAVLLIGGIAVGLIASQVGGDDSAPAAAKPDTAAARPAGKPEDASAKVAPTVTDDDAEPAEPAAAKPAAAAKPIADDDEAAAPEPTDEPAAPVAHPALGGDCELAVTADADNATVYLGTHNLGRAPLRTAIPCNAAKVSIAHPRYERFEKAIAPVAGTPVSIDAHLSRPEIRLQVVTRPAGASITIDGRGVGKSPASAVVKGFTSIKVEASFPGYQPVTQRMYVKRDTRKVALTLKKARKGK
jgi:hypothetical protein